MTPINLDHNATTPILPEVLEAIVECHRQGYSNPASQHASGRQARRVLEDAREEIGRLLGADLIGRQPDKLIFTSGGTEANNLAIFGLAHAAGTQPGEAIVSAIEHPSVLGPVEQLERGGWAIHRLGVTRDGLANVERFAGLLNERTRFASIMLANNETGVLQPLAKLAEIAAKAGVPLHTDAVQVVGKLPVDFRQLQVAALTTSAHKFHGPPGVGGARGALWSATGPTFVRRLSAVGTAARHGNGGPGCRHAQGPRDFCSRRRRAGAPPARAAQSAGGGSEVRLPACRGQRRGANRLPHTSNLAFVGLDRQALSMALDLAGVACSTGSACASGSSEPSHVLLAMGLERELVNSSLRFSLGAETTAADINEAVRRIVATTANLSRPTDRRIAAAV